MGGSCLASFYDILAQTVRPPSRTAFCHPPALRAPPSSEGVS